MISTYRRSPQATDNPVLETSYSRTCESHGCTEQQDRRAVISASLGIALNMDRLTTLGMNFPGLESVTVAKGIRSEGRERRRRGACAAFCHCSIQDAEGRVSRHVRFGKGFALGRSECSGRDKSDFHLRCQCARHCVSTHTITGFS